jgi:hypothetical protein
MARRSCCGPTRRATPSRCHDAQVCHTHRGRAVSAWNSCDRLRHTRRRGRAARRLRWGSFRACSGVRPGYRPQERSPFNPPRWDRQREPVLSRSIGDGLHEDIDITNYGLNPVRFNLEIAIRSDFADIFEVKAKRIVRRGRINTDWLPDSSALTMIYRNQDFSRAIHVTPRNNDSPAALRQR